MLGNTSFVHASDGPSPRIGPAMIYDPVGERVLLFGGSIWQNNQYTFYNDLWSFSDGAWTMIDTPGSKPSGRFNIPMTYIPDTHQIFLFGGFGSSDRLGDTWTYDIEENQWTRLSTETRPPNRSDAAITYDPENEIVVMFGGYGLNDDIMDDTWVFEFSEMDWIEMDPSNRPLEQYGGQMVYDSANGMLLMYPGHWNLMSGDTMVSHGYGGQIWVYSYEEDNWTELETSPKPRGRYWFSLAYDSSDGVLVLFGGSVGGGNQVSDTWKYDYSTNTWTEIETQTHPANRANSYMAYDASRDIIVLFGGSLFGQVTYDDTWILDMESGSWSEVSEETDNVVVEDSQSIPGFSAYTITVGIVIILWINLSHKLRV